MTELDPELKGLIGDAGGAGPTDGQRRRMRAVILAQASTAALTASSQAAAVEVTAALSAAAAVGATTAPVAGAASAGAVVSVGATAAGSSLVAIAAKLVAIGAVVTGIGAGGYTVVSGHLPGSAARAARDPGALVAVGANANPETLVPIGAAASRAAKAPVEAPPAVVPVPEVNPPPPEPPAKPVLAASRSSVAAPRSNPTPHVGVDTLDTFEDETQALRSALSSLRSGSAGAALAALDEQDRRFRRTGVLGEERAVARIETLCALGRTREAGERATRFLAQHPDSLQAARVRASCGGPAPQ